MFQDRKLRDQIDLYLRGQLTGAEKLMFEKEMDENPSIRRTYNAYKEIMTGFHRKFNNDFHEEYKEMGYNQEIETRMTETFVILKRVGVFVGIAVAVLLLALAPGWLPDNWPFG